MLSFALLFLLCCYKQSQAACTFGWFGPNCQYKCHCDTSGQCDVTGQCSTKCAAGWFGLKCQYQDLTALPGVTVTTTPSQTTSTWLNDGDDVTCNDDQSLQSLKISWNTSNPFTWMRIKVKEPTAKLEFTITTTTANSQTLDCEPLISVIDDTTIDFRCDVNDTIQQVIVTGYGVKYVCSLYMNGGRNVALRQTAVQTSTFLTSEASLAVDGNSNSSFSQGTCTHTDITDTNPSWTLTLDSVKSVQRFVLYNRGDCCSFQLKNFKLETLDVNNTILWTYRDTRGTMMVYTVSTSQRNDVFKIRISPVKQFIESFFVLMLCEVEVYGECAAGMWDLQCNGTCPKGCSTWCHHDTGQCPSCLGFSDPPLCKAVCLEGYYGFNCLSKCSSHCYNNSCDRLTGVCDKECLGYSDPTVCTIACAEGYFGKNCLSHCSSSCFENSCDKVTGLCSKACVGFMDFPTCITLLFLLNLSYHSAWW
ncbi:hypothetical protein Btru_033713 [Bulinus truncatus]|nr:hypothetical protein Btru_033713 [Bulinus truncatus]